MNQSFRAYSLDIHRATLHRLTFTCLIQRFSRVVVLSSVQFAAAHEKTALEKSKAASDCQIIANRTLYVGLS
jgi:hypothetical protein